MAARRARYRYGTHGTPTRESLETAWSELAGAAGTVLTPSGLAAITVGLLACLKAGDHLVISFQLDPESRAATLRNISELTRQLTEDSDPQQKEFKL